MVTKTQGFTLVELLIAMVLALMVAGTAVGLITDALQSARTAGDIQKSQRNLTATTDLLWPRLRQASSVTNADTHGGTAIRIERQVSRAHEGVDCTGKTLEAGKSVSEVYFTTDDATLRCRVDDERQAKVAFGVESIELTRVMTDTDQDGRTNETYDTDFPSGADVIGVEVTIEQQWVSDKTRTIPLTAALRNKVLTRRGREGDDDG